MKHWTGQRRRASNGGSATHRHSRIWTDRRDGRGWSVRVFWSFDHLRVGQIVFESSEDAHTTWWASPRPLGRLTERELEQLLDDARTR